MSMHFTYAQVLAAAEAAVEEKGEGYIYSRCEFTPSSSFMGGCLYVHRDGEYGDKIPGCLVGNIFNRLGIDIYGKYGLLPSQMDYIGDALEVITAMSHQGITFDEKSCDFLLYAQRQQDAGSTWGESLAVAKQIVKEKHSE